jgi:hypothetical protein
MQEIISFNITNNTNGTVPISILGNNADAMDTSNATTQYQWNLTGFTITNENTISIQYKPSGTSIFLVAQLSFSGTTLQSVCDTLNTLDFGFFFITTSGGSTFINNYNDNITFADLQIYNPAFTTALNYQFNYSSGSVKIRKNGIDVYVNGSPNTDSGNIPVIAGDSIEFLGTTGLSPLVTNVSIFNITTSTFIYNNTTITATSFTQTFTLLSNNQYLLEMNN